MTNINVDTEHSSVIAQPVSVNGTEMICMPVAREGVQYLFPLALVAHLVVIPYEWMEISMIHSVYEESDRVIEGGCGIGLTTAHLARIVEKVWGYEPLPEYAELAKMNCEYNDFCDGKVEMHKAALGVGNGTAPYHRRYLASASSGLPNELYSDEEEDEFIANVLSIDEQVAELNATGLHLDVEGSEYELIMNMNLEPLHKVTFEAHPTVLGEERMQEIFDRLEENGLELVGMGGRRNYPTHNYAAAFVRPEYVDSVRGKLRETPSLELGNETAS